MVLIRQIAMFYVNTEIYCWSCLSCRLPMLRSTCLRCLHSRSRQMTHAALSRSTVKVHILVTFVVSSEQNWADKFISLETKSSYLSVRHNSFCYLPHLYVCKVDFTLCVRDLVWLMLFKTALENIGIWNERKVLRQLLNTYLFTSRCIYFARETCTSLLYICYFDIPDLSDLYEAKWISAILLISWIICHGRDGCTLINNKSAFLDV